MVCGISDLPTEEQVLIFISVLFSVFILAPRVAIIADVGVMVFV